MSLPSGWEPGTCALCGRTSDRVVTVAPDPLTGTGRFRLVRCAGCDTVFISPRPGREAIGQYYPEAYGPHRSLDAPGRRFRKRKSRRFEPVLHLPPGRYLDVGCGSGADLVRMSERGWKVAGFDVSERAAAAGRASGLDIRSGSELADARFDGASFDLVTLFCVLPHVHDPLALLREIHRLLRPGGTLFMTVPNLHSVNFWLFRSHWYHLEPPRHLHFFSARSFRAMADRSGFAAAGRRFRSGGGGFKNSLRYAEVRSRPGGFLHPLTRIKPVRGFARGFFRWIVDPAGLGDTVDLWWTRA